MTAPYPIRGGDADVEDLLWAKPLIADFGLAAEDVAEEWRYRKGQNRAEGNLWLRKVHQVLMAESKIVRDVHTTDDLDSVARWLAEQCERFTTKSELDAFVQRHELPEIKGKSSKSRLARAQDWQVWRQKLRKRVAQYRDQIMRHIGRVHQQQQIYCSNHAVALHRQQQRKNRRLLDKITLVNDELDQECSLADAVDSSVANPEKRRTELLTRISGFERYALEEDHRAVFITLTCPSKYHAIHQDGRRNRKWNGTTPRQANDYLCRLGERIGRSLTHYGVDRYGFRMVEPHHDGTPHWHFLLFVPLQHAKTLQDVFRRYALEEDGDEPGAKKHRVTFEWIDPEKGSAVGYAVKYVCKNIDGHGVGEDLYGYSAEASAGRIQAWARTWNIRQFQQFGGPPVTPWREYRRVRDPAAIPPAHLKPWVHASAPGGLKPDWCGFMRSMGGHNAGRNQPTRLVRGQRWCAVTGECTPYVNRYGEVLDGNALPIIGLERDGVQLRTRTGFWRQEWNAETEETWKRSPYRQVCTAPLAVTRPVSGGRSRPMASTAAFRKPASVADNLCATITATGSQVTGIPAGTTVPGREALKQLPPGNPNDPNARWSVIRDGAAVGPWTCDNNCRFEDDGAGNRRGPPSFRA